MITEIGEYLVGAYLKVVEKCDCVDYNVHFPGGGLKGLDELDVVGFSFGARVAFICEVITHIKGTLYGSGNQETVERIRGKHEKQKRYAKDHLGHLETHRFMLWSPVVPQGYLTENLAQIQGLELVINQEYARKVNQLREQARTMTHDVGNPAFRLLQILEHMRA